MDEPMPHYVLAPRLRALLTEASEHRRRGDHALAEYIELLAAIAVRTAEIQAVGHD